MKFSFLFEAFYYPAFYTMFFAMYQFKEYHSNLSEAEANLALAIIMVIILHGLLVFTSLHISENKIKNKKRTWKT